MEKGYLVLLLFQCMVFPLSCNFGRNNPFDEGGPNFIPPQITINEEASGFKNQDTIHFDSVNIVVVGNREQSIFTLKVDDGNWMPEWQTADTFGFGGLIDGAHTLYINTMYRGGEMVVSDSISFYVLTKGYKPVFKNQNDTTITLFEGKPLTLSVQAEGKKPFNYSWLKGASVLEGKNSDTLKITSFTVNDSASYKCIVANEYGKDTSRIFILKYRPYSGGIKGVITDLSGKNLKDAMITLSPAGKKDTTDSAGSFALTSLSGNSYTLQISLSKYHDTTLSNVVVNDSETVVLQTIKLKMIDTTTYKVVYNGNENDSGTVPSDTTKYKPGSKITVAGSGNLSRIGHSFLKWNTKKDGSGDAVSPGDSFTVNGNVTFYVQWIVKQFTLSFNDNGSTSGEVPEQKQYDYQKSISIPDKGTLDRVGYSFTRWNKKKDGSGKGYAADDTLLMSASDVELFAQWKALPTHNVTYNNNGADTGKVPVDSNSYYKGKEVTVAGNPGNLYRDGYSFSGWNTKTDMTGDTYNAGAKFAMPDSAVTLFVKWTTNPTYSIIYHSATSTGGAVPATVNADSGLQVTIADSGSLYKTGYTFVGWNTREDGSGKAYKTGDKVVMDTVNIELYDQWTKAQYTVTYYGNGNTSGEAPTLTKHLYGTQITVANSGTLEKTGYTFIGWNTDSIGNGLDYAAGAPLIIEANNVNLYARWSINKYTVNFNSNGGNTINSKSIKHNDTVPIPPAPVKQSYTFDGWFKDSTCNQVWNFATLITKPVTLYAKWIIKDIDGNTYTEVTIGKQVWLVENLMTSRYKDSTDIPSVLENNVWSTLSTPAYCWYPDVFSANKKYGALYNWYVVRPENLKKIAPEGWHVPTDEEWDTLISYLGGITGAGGKLKESATLHWRPPNSDATNMSGFSALPAGCRYYNGDFDGTGTNCYWWTVTLHYSDDPLCYGINCYNSDVVRNDSNMKSGYSVRCIRDW